MQWQSEIVDTTFKGNANRHIRQIWNERSIKLLNFAFNRQTMPRERGEKQQVVLTLCV